MSRKQLYIWLSFAYIIGSMWITYCYFTGNKGFWKGCWIKQIYHIPCPACGSTRAINSLLTGNIIESLLINPIGILIVTLMTIIPVWCLFDFILKKNSVWRFYLFIEDKLKNKLILYPFLFLILINWCWNIIKFYS